MGASDNILKPKYKDYVSTYGQFSNVKVAWLGQQDPNDKSLKNVGMFYNLASLFDGHCQHDFYDIENIKSWDVHNEWNIKGYDLVLCFRLTYLIQSSSHLIKQLKKTVDNNKIVLCDFVSGNVRKGEHMKHGVVRWNTDNLVCYLPEYYIHAKPSLTYEVSSKEHLLDKNMLNDAGLELCNYTSFQCPKGRHYVIARVVNE